MHNLVINTFISTVIIYVLLLTIIFVFSNNTRLVSGTDEGEVLMWSLKDYSIIQHLPGKF